MAKEAALKGEKNRNKPAVCFDTNLCRGCGVCSTGCPAEAIEMIPLS
jgi:Pyruvate/2-oxoacid:ferredoxin oxidoreductase delta subunit